MGELKRQKEKAQPFPESAYQNMTLTDLVLYALLSLEQKGIEATFENLIAESFELFPKKFYLQGYPEYPDGNRIRREIQRIEGAFSTPGMQKLASGNMKNSYKLTEIGLNRATEVRYGLEPKKKNENLEKRIEDRRGKMGRMIWEIEKHPLYRRYLENKGNIDVPETLLRSLLFATMETSEEKLQEKMETLMSYCESLGRDDIKEFLNFCKSKHKEIFYSKG